MNQSSSQWQYMAQALEAAERALFVTDPNPRVGCVLVADDAVVGVGSTSPVGGPHAEVHAIAAAGERAKGATAYVTLEPCCHHGRTPPCTDALIAAGVRHVVAAIHDPNPLVSGRGLAALEAAGITTEVGLGAAEARALNIGFITRMQHARPWVRLKLAASVDGRSAMASGESRWITGAAARADVHRWRARSSAVVTGAGTVNADNPQMTARLNIPVRQPLRIVLSARLGIAPEAKIFDRGSDDDLRALVAMSAAAVLTPREQALREYLLQREVEVIALEEDDFGVSVGALLRHLNSLQINEVWVECGARLAGSFLQNGCVDELFIYVGAKLLGDQAKPMVSLRGIDRLSESIALAEPEVRIFDSDVRLRYLVQGDTAQ